MSVYRVIDKLELTVKEGGWLPMGSRIVNQERMLDLIEKLRSSLPEEVSRAKAVTKEKDRLLEQAKEQADRIVEEASSTKTQLLSDSEMIKQAQDRAERILADAEARALEVRQGADEYADRVLSALDGSLASSLAAVKKGREALAGGLSSNGSLRQRERR
ncbi:MAG: ATPase [Candidatus Eremiobacteraeota bacterium]|nr:ATPase [Candidatus Eremiobacteraeota bacterium]MBC5826969.1 ATPase [Candidatus Eremiobacteraeota bacterium]